MQVILPLTRDLVVNADVPQSRGRLIFLCIAGSHAYGTSRPTSDTDVRGVYVPYPEDFLSYRSCDQEIEWKQPGEKIEGKIYDVRKFVRLALNGNPNILEQLWIPDHLSSWTHPDFQPLIDCRSWFVSQRAIKAYSGMSTGQLKRSANGSDPKALLHHYRIASEILHIARTSDLQIKHPDILHILENKYPGPHGNSIQEVMDCASDLLVFAKDLGSRNLPENPDERAADTYLINLLRKEVVSWKNAP